MSGMGLLSSVAELSARFVGETVIYAIIASILGYVIHKAWPRSLNPDIFAVVLPLLLLALAAYWGSAAAAEAIVLFIALAVAAFFVGMA
mgnify:CR=1 FL=1